MAVALIIGGQWCSSSLGAQRPSSAHNVSFLLSFHSSFPFHPSLSILPLLPFILVKKKILVASVCQHERQEENTSMILICLRYE